MFRVRAMAAVLVGGSAMAATIIPGDARRGEQFFQSQQCEQCHSFNGKGGTSAPDLSKRSAGRGYTPALMATVMWNHAPDMWSAMQKQGIARPTVRPESAADLFAYFVSARYFERPGDSARGKRVFAVRHCADCHGIATAVAGGGPPVSSWESLADPLLLVQPMWNHGTKMRAAFAARNLAWARLTSQELTDVIAYLQELPQTQAVARTFQLPPAGNGEKVFQSKGCADCHTGDRAPESLMRNDVRTGTSMWARPRSLALQNRLLNQTLTDIAVDMWNHLPKMKQPPPTLAPEEMREIIAYIWARQYFTGRGNAASGKKIFAEKHCAKCHDDPSTGAPSLGKGRDGHSSITMVAALWQHGPRMLELMNQKQWAWAQFREQQMSDLIAYLNSL